jgi:hypothetical protein
VGLGRDLRKARRLSLQQWRDIATAARELAIARFRLAFEDAAVLFARDSPSSATLPDGELIDRVAFAVPRMAARVPWHATCLVQALAAQRWLGRSGIQSKIVLGARTLAEDALDAHAWLEVDGRVIVGGEITDYSRFNTRDSD